MKRIFFDTNILVYLFDGDATKKQATSRELLATSAKEGWFLSSTQVLQEFYVVVTGKLAVPLSSEDAEQAIRKLLSLPIVEIDGETLLYAIQIKRRYGFSFWDALIVQAALKGGAQDLYTEDMQHGQIIEGLRIINPFL